MRDAEAAQGLAEAGLTLDVAEELLPGAYEALAFLGGGKTPDPYLAPWQSSANRASSQSKSGTDFLHQLFVRARVGLSLWRLLARGEVGPDECQRRGAQRLPLAAVWAAHPGGSRGARLALSRTEARVLRKRRANPILRTSRGPFSGVF